LLTSLNHFMTAMVTSLGPAVCTLVEDPLFGTTLLACDTLYAALYGHLGRLLPSDLTALRANLADTVFVSGVDDIRLFIAHHRITHGTFAVNLQPIGNEQQIATLRAALVPCGLWEGVFAHFIQRYYEPVQQTFAHYEELLLQAADNMLSTATAGTSGYAHGAAVSHCKGCQCGIAAAVTTATAAPRALTTFYCWTHGAGGHSGADCKHIATGHQPSATRSSAHGGNPHTIGSQAARLWAKDHMPN
jgi:hypothetical protein